MPARLAYAYIDTETRSRLSEDGQLAFDEYLGVAGASRRREERRMADLAASGFEVG